MGLSNQKMKADTLVRSVMIRSRQAGGASSGAAPCQRRSRRGGADGGREPRPPVVASQPPAADEGVKVPSLLKQTEPVNVRSNRLDYDGASSLATYEGNATLWQDDTTIKADKIVVEDKTGNLRATTTS